MRLLRKLADPRILAKLEYKLKSRLGLYKDLTDAEFLKKIYKVRFGRELDLENPKTFNEKLQWLKLYDRKPIYTKMVDKYEVKKLIADMIGEEYVVPCLGVWEKFSDIDFNTLPERFVLKCTHDCGGLVICRDKSLLDLKKAEAKVEKSLKRNFFFVGREWPYKDVKPRIIAEQFIGDPSRVLDVYKFFCFDGKVELIQVIQDDKTPKESIDYFDTDWNLLKLKQNFPNSKKHLKKPERLDKMIELSKLLSKGHPFIRVDWYDDGENVKFSEFTFYSDNGLAKFKPETWDYKLGDLIQLPEKEVN